MSAQATPTVEDYVKAIYLAAEGPDLVPMGQVARALAVTPGTATVMVKGLAERGLAEYEPRQGVRLRAEGERLALSVIRRHRLIELFLVQTLGMDWNEIHAEAELLEHAVSDRVLEALDAFLGFPTVDPHGDPIPDAAGSMGDRDLFPLSQGTVGKQVRVARIADQEPQFLDFVQRSGLMPGVRLRVQGQDAVASTTAITLDNGGALTLGRTASDKILVEIWEGREALR